MLPVQPKSRLARFWVEQPESGWKLAFVNHDEVYRDGAWLMWCLVVYDRERCAHVLVPAWAWGGNETEVK